MERVALMRRQRHYSSNKSVIDIGVISLAVWSANAGFNSRNSSPVLSGVST